MKLDMTFYISTNNKHLKCLEVFIYLFNKFMGRNKLVILGYDKPDFTLTDNCKFISMGKQGPVEEWSNDLRKYFLTIKDKHIIYATEDAFLYKKSNIEYMNYLIEFVKSRNSIGRLNLVNIGEENGDKLTNSRHYNSEFYETIDSKFGKIDLYKLVNSNYTLTTQMSIWNREFFLRYLVDGETPWSFEQAQSVNAAKDKDYDVIMLDNVYPLFKKEGYAADRGWEYTQHWLHYIENEKLKEQIIKW